MAADRALCTPRTVILKRRLMSGLPLESRAAIPEIERHGEEGALALEELLVVDGKDQNAAACALERLGAVGAEIFTRHLDDDKGPARVSAAIKLSNMGEFATFAAEAMAKRLESQDSDVRRRAAENLGLLGPAAHVHAETLATHLGDANAWVRWNSAKALRLMGQAGVNALSARLGDSRAIVRRSAAQALEQMGDMGVAAFAGRVHESMDPLAGSVASEALKRLSPDGSPTAIRSIGAELASILNVDPQVQHKAVASLAQRGVAAAPNLVALSKRLENGDAWIRGKAIEAMVVNSEASAAALAGRIDDRDVHVRRRAVDGLIKLGAAASPHVNTIASRLHDPNPTVRWKSVAAVNGVQLVAAANGVQLVQVNGDETSRARFSAAKMKAFAFMPKPPKTSEEEDLGQTVQILMGALPDVVAGSLGKILKESGESSSNGKAEPAASFRWPHRGHEMAQC